METHRDKLDNGYIGRVQELEREEDNVSALTWRSQYHIGRGGFG